MGIHDIRSWARCFCRCLVLAGRRDKSGGSQAKGPLGSSGWVEFMSFRLYFRRFDAGCATCVGQCTFLGDCFSAVASHEETCPAVSSVHFWAFQSLYRLNEFPPLHGERQFYQQFSTKFCTLLGFCNKKLCLKTIFQLSGFWRLTHTFM